MLKKPIALIGMMGSGKTTVGRLLAESLGAEFVDTDAMVEAAAGKTVADIINGEGEAAFRRLEQVALAEALSAPRVVATGGGIVLSEDNRALLRAQAQVVYLAAAAEVLVRRVAAEVSSRPLLQGVQLEERIAALLREREGRYEAAAHHRIEQESGQLPGSVAEAVLSLVTP